MHRCSMYMNTYVNTYIYIHREREIYTLTLGSPTYHSSSLPVTVSLQDGIGLPCEAAARRRGCQRPIVSGFGAQNLLMGMVVRARSLKY